VDAGDGERSSWLTLATKSRRFSSTWASLSAMMLSPRQLTHLIDAGDGGAAAELAALMSSAARVMTVRGLTMLGCTEARRSATSAAMEKAAHDLPHDAAVLRLDDLRAGMDEHRTQNAPVLHPRHATVNTVPWPRW
jgi:hypothetical protein